MKYVCKECGEVFEEWEADGCYEDIESFEGITHYALTCRCPYCGSDEIVEGDTCELCDSGVEIDDMYDGICINCLREACDMNAAILYLMDADALAEFMEWPREDEALYKALTARMKENREELLADLQEFILDNEPQEFAEWLQGRR